MTLVIHAKNTLNEVIGFNALRPLANAPDRLPVFRLQFHGLDRSRPARCAIGETLKLSPEQKGLMVAVPILSGAILRILLGLLVDRIGAKNAGIMAENNRHNRTGGGLDFRTAQLRGGTINGRRPWLCWREFCRCIAAGWTLVSAKYAGCCDGARGCGKYWCRTG